MNQEMIPESRTYRHRICNTQTGVDGIHFEYLSNPFAAIATTLCCHCNAYLPVSEFEWDDSGEQITKYYARHSANTTSLERFLCSRPFFNTAIAAGLLLGAAAGFALSGNAALWLRVLATAIAGFVGLISAGQLIISVFRKRVLWSACEVRDSRMLK